jgi:hypothetical protein
LIRLHDIRRIEPKAPDVTLGGIYLQEIVMDKTTVALIGAAAALSAGPALSAVPSGEPAIPVAASYAELLAPIPNAVERLRMAEAEAQTQQPQLIEAQYVTHHHHHHHHHHHNRRWYLSNGYYWHNGGWALRPRAHHHHHHHHNHY